MNELVSDILVYFERISTFDITDLSTPDIILLKQMATLLKRPFMTLSEKKFVLLNSIESKDFKKIEELFCVFGEPLYRDPEVKSALKQLYIETACIYLERQCNLFYNEDRDIYFGPCLNCYVKQNGSYVFGYEDNMNLYTEYICCFNVEHELFYHPAFLRIKNLAGYKFVKKTQFGFIIKKEIVNNNQDLPPRRDNLDDVLNDVPNPVDELDSDLEDIP